MNKYLQQDTPTTETLLFKTSYIRWESICTNIPKTYGFSSWLEERGREGQEKEKAETPNSWKASLFSENEGIERKMTWHISGYRKPFQGWDRGSCGQGGPRPYDLSGTMGKGKTTWQVRFPPDIYNFIIILTYFLAFKAGFWIQIK